jgi:hypothetical protein
MGVAELERIRVELEMAAASGYAIVPAPAAALHHFPPPTPATCFVPGVAMAAHHQYVHVPADISRTSGFWWFMLTSSSQEFSLFTARIPDELLNGDMRFVNAGWKWSYASRVLHSVLPRAALRQRFSDQVN